MEAIKSARQSLDQEETDSRREFKHVPLGSESLVMVATDSLLKEMTMLYLASKSSKDSPMELLFAFLAHCILLETTSVEERAQDIATANSRLTKIILKIFLPTIFFALDNAASSRNVFYDVDGRIYLALVNFLMDNHTLPMHELIGVTVCDRVQALWSGSNLPSVDFGILAGRFSVSPTSPRKSLVVSKPLRLLRFDNEVFNKELASIQVTGEDDDDGCDSAPKFNFGQGVLFSDTHHWHNSKAILPRHMGGEDTKPKNEWHRRKLLKLEQRFMSNLQRQAGTLTGALGAILAQIVIPPVGSRVNRTKGKGHLALTAKNHETVRALCYVAMYTDDTILGDENHRPVEG